jgi:hypothetical protein
MTHSPSVMFVVHLNISEGDVENFPKTWPASCLSRSRERVAGIH